MVLVRKKVSNSLIFIFSCFLVLCRISHCVKTSKNIIIAHVPFSLILLISFSFQISFSRAFFKTISASCDMTVG
ncbi:hypothetical protein BC941DRAFT_409878 [Chlamydoabsidia padenii]|nr:hypothetical protein BC941DRAFT_409878 [Chlamydoabsidia padenii]